MIHTYSSKRNISQFNRALYYTIIAEQIGMKVAAAESAAANQPKDIDMNSLPF